MPADAGIFISGSSEFAADHILAGGIAAAAYPQTGRLMPRQT